MKAPVLGFSGAAWWWSESMSNKRSVLDDFRSWNRSAFI